MLTIYGWCQCVNMNVFPFIYVSFLLFFCVALLSNVLSCCWLDGKWYNIPIWYAYGTRHTIHTHNIFFIFFFFKIFFSALAFLSFLFVIMSEKPLIIKLHGTFSHIRNYSIRLCVIFMHFNRNLVVDFFFRSLFFLLYGHDDLRVPRGDIFVEEQPTADYAYKNFFFYFSFNLHRSISDSF